jgi:hypothetical protein
MAHIIEPSPSSSEPTCRLDSTRRYDRRVREADADAIVQEWTRRSGAEPPSLPAFLLDALPDVEAWAVRKPGPVEPQLLAVSAGHLHRVSSAEVDGHRALALQRWAQRDVTLAMHE